MFLKEAQTLLNHYTITYYQPENHGQLELAIRTVIRDELIQMSDEGSAPWFHERSSD